MRALCRLFVLCLLCGFSTPAFAQAVSEPLFRDGDTIVFFGDSITQGGNYIDHFEAYLLCQYPDRKFRVLNRGISSETISGTSETDHDPRRPWAHERFTRDITPLKPQVLIACFGMNDGNYHSFDWARFEKYQQGIRRLIERAKNEAGVRDLILMTPPPYDPYSRKNSDPMAKEYGYKYAAIDYDHTLAKYSEWLVTLQGEGYRVVDLHSALSEHVRRRRQSQVSFTLSPDAVHPNMTGHWLMAVALIHAVPPKSRLLGNGQHQPPKPDYSNGNLYFQATDASRPWSKALKLAGFPPVDPSVEFDSFSTEPLRPGQSAPPSIRWKTDESHAEDKYHLSLNDVVIGRHTGQALNAGIPIPNWKELGIVQQRAKLLEKVRERRTLEYWQFRAGTDKPLGNKPPVEDIPKKIAELTAEIEQLRQPVEVMIRIEPVK